MLPANDRIGKKHCANVLQTLRACIESGAMSSPKLQFIAEKLYEKMNEREITDALREMGVDVTQPTVNRIRCGKIKRTSHDIGRGLEHLYYSRFPQQQSA
jgi:hypothetical protein